MENPAATQLPEVDALPDGFVDGTAEPLCPPTPNNEEEKSDFRINSGNRLDELEHELVDSDDKGDVEKNFGSPLIPGLADSTHEDSSEVSGSCEVKEQAQEKFQSSDKYKLVVQPTHAKEKSLLDGEDSLKNRKQETSEAKKNAKRGFKSEKELLQFTLKYQQVLAERDAAIAVRDKLESLCRELQRQNKMLMDECKRVSTEGQNLRLDLSAKFQDAIKEVSSKLEQQKDECLSQLKENEMLKVKLKQLAEQYVLSEQHHEQELKQKSLELQIADLKIKQHQEKVIQEQSQMKVYAEQVSQLLETEKNLRLQLTADGEKFQQFQDALAKSNEVFETFKQEIEKMAKSIKDLKKENAFLKNKCDKSHITLIELIDERERSKKQMEKLKNQKEKLESLCRSLRAERKRNPVGGNDSDPSLSQNPVGGNESNPGLTVNSGS